MIMIIIDIMIIRIESEISIFFFLDFYFSFKEIESSRWLYNSGRTLLLSRVLDFNIY